MSDREEKEYYRGRRGWIFIIPVLCAVLFFMWWYFWYNRTADIIELTGNDYYEKEKLIELILPGPLDRNTLYLQKYFDPEKLEIPFIEDIELTVINPHTVSIRVYEKAFSGCVKYLGSYMYFDKDGVVIDTKDYLREGVPLIVGLSFDSIRLSEPLPTARKDVFTTIIELTRAMNKYEMVADRISFDDNLDISLGYGKVDVFIKNITDIDKKLLYAQEIIPTLMGQKGTLDMQHLKDESDRIIFIPSES